MFNEEIQKRLGLSSDDAEAVKLGQNVEDVDPASVLEVIADAAETLAQEVQRSLDFFSATSADEKIQKLYIAGGVAKTSQVQVALERRLGLSVEVIDPFRQIVVNEKEFDPEYIHSVGPLFPIALGLAMRRLGDK
jgi:type IV pilus assembly protein PilM